METMTINERLKELRIENGLTQKQLADKLGLGQTTIATHEKSHMPQLDSLIAYADYFECTLDYLAGREKTPLPYALTEEEREWVRLFRSLKPQTKSLAKKQLELLAAFDGSRG